MKDLTKEEMVHLLETVLDGTLALTDGTRPYCIPFGFVYQNDTVYLSLFPKGRKQEYFQKNNNVCFNIYSWNDDRTEWSSVVVDGKIEQVTDIETIALVVKLNMEKMGMDPSQYLDKRVEFYRKNLDNPKALKIFKIKAETMGGKKMPTTIGE